MLFSTYKKVSIIGYAVVAVLVGGLLYLISPFLGIFFLVAMGLVALVFPLHFALVEARLDDHGGRIPMPYMGLGMWGVDIVDDGVDPNVTRPLGAGPGEAVNGPCLGSVDREIL